MSAIITKQFAPVEPSRDFVALGDAVMRGVPMLRRDLTLERVAEAHCIATQALEPASPVLVTAWLNSLSEVVVNAPDVAGMAGEKCKIICEICSDLPAGVWTRETMMAWARSGERGKFWPAPAELYAHLLPFAEKIRWQVHAARKVVKMAEAAKDAPKRRTPEERAAVERAVNAWKGRQPVQPKDAVKRMQPDQPSLRQRIAEYRRQLETAAPEARAWLEPLITNLEAQHAAICRKQPRGFTESAVRA